MIIIWGSRALKRREGTLRYNCMICPSSSLTVHSYRKWFTLFFIPIFPIGSREYYVKCRECRNSYKMPYIEELMQQHDFMEE